METEREKELSVKEIEAAIKFLDDAPMPMEGRMFRRIRKLKKSALNLKAKADTEG